MAQITQVVEDTANQFWAVRDAPEGLEHCYLGIPVKRSKGGFIPKAKARKTLVRRAGCQVVGSAPGVSWED